MAKIENKKIILQVIPAMEMGGAEVGTLDVSSYMKKKGWNVIVTSSGGSLVEKLNFRKIKHIKLPLNSKNPLIIFFNIQAYSQDIDYTKKVESLDSTVETLYSVISGDKGVARDWTLFKYLFHKDAKLIPTKTNKEGKKVACFMSVDEYINTSGKYLFENGFHESDTSIKLSNQYKIPLYVKTIPKGYLWNKLDQIHKLNNCFTDFTHPRQIAAISQWKGLGDIILLKDDENETYNNNTFIITYISKEKVKITNIDNLSPVFFTHLRYYRLCQKKRCFQVNRQSFLPTFRSNFFNTLP